MKTSFWRALLSLAGAEGLEPPKAVLETAGLPLAYAPSEGEQVHAKTQKDTDSDGNPRQSITHVPEHSQGSPLNYVKLIRILRIHTKTFNYKSLILLGIVLYSIWFLRSGFSAGLTHDDLMNTYRAWAADWRDLLLDNLFYFKPSSQFRPFPALLLKGWFGKFSFDLFPLRILCVSFLFLNAVLVGLITRKISHSDWAGGLAMLIYVFHWGWFSLYLSSGFIYDIFCAFFCLLAFWCYLKDEWRFRILATLFYICAMNSKEMAVGFPVMVFFYELALHFPKIELKKLIWPLIYGVMTLPFIFFRVMSTQGLGNIHGYTVDPTLRHYLSQFGRYIRAWTHTEISLAGALVFILPLALFIVAFLVKELRIATWGFLSFAVGILPVATLIHPRNLDSIYVPTAFLVIAVSIVAVKAMHRSDSRSALLILVTMFFMARMNIRSLPGEGYRAENQEIQKTRDSLQHFYTKNPDAALTVVEKDVFRDDLWSTFFLGAMTQGKKDIPLFILNKLPEQDQVRLRNEAKYTLSWNGTDWDIKSINPSRSK